MSPNYTLHGWHLSYFSGKTRGYLNFKGVPFRDKNVHALDLMWRLPKKIGASGVMPIIETKTGECLTDTTLIMEELDKRHPESNVEPSTPKQLIAAMIFEAWADEYWLPTGMHYRWNYPENAKLFKSDAAQFLLPYVPNVIRMPLVNKVANSLRNFCPTAGIVPDQFQMMETWTERVLDLLDAHFVKHDFLFGSKPSIADFGLLGPLYGHFNRDPYPKRVLMDPRPNLQAWVDRTHAGEGRDGEYLPGDEIPESLNEIFAIILKEFMPMASDIVRVLKEYVGKQGKKSGDNIRRDLAEISFPMGEGTFKRVGLPYTLWMVQRIAKRFHTLPEKDQALVDQWMAQYGQDGFFASDLGPALNRRGVKTRLA